MNSVIRYRNGRSLIDQMDEIFDSMFSSPVEPSYRRPVVDIKEEADRYVLTAELPGLSEKDVTVTVEDSRLKIESITHEEKKEESEKGTYLHRERRTMKFSRSFGLPRDVDQTAIKAEFENGLLTLSLPKAEEAKPRSIKIN